MEFTPWETLTSIRNIKWILNTHRQTYTHTHIILLSHMTDTPITLIVSYVLTYSSIDVYKGQQINFFFLIIFYNFANFLNLIDFSRIRLKTQPTFTTGTWFTKFKSMNLGWFFTQHPTDLFFKEPRPVTTIPISLSCNLFYETWSWYHGWTWHQ